MRVYVLIGVSGSGKSIIGQLLAEALGITFYDADDFHPVANKEKMASGRALTDNDRLPWLSNLAERMSEWQKEGAVLACSALKEPYRRVLMQEGNQIQWVYLKGSQDLIRKRLDEREGHFMPAGLLQSQFADLEEPVYGWKVNVRPSPEVMVENILARVDAFAKKPVGLIGLVVYNRDTAGEENVVSDFIEGWETDAQLSGTTTLTQFVESLPRPRRILGMVPAG